LKASVRCLIGTLFRLLSGGIQVNHEKSVRIADIPDEIRKKYFSLACFERHGYTTRSVVRLITTYFCVIHFNAVLLPKLFFFFPPLALQPQFFGPWPTSMKLSLRFSRS
jgi:hypothetical protein